MLWSRIKEKRAGSDVDLMLNDKSPIKMDNRQKIGKLTIKDSKIGRVDIQYKKNPVTREFYVSNSLKLTISADGNNLQNLTADEYRARVKEAFDHLDAIYGVKVNYDILQIKELEINATFYLAHKYEEYKDSILMMIRNAPAKRFSDKHNNRIKYATWSQADAAAQKESIETALVKNNSIELKIYSKGKWLKDKGFCLFDDDPQIMRVEYRVKDSRILTSHFGDNLVSSLSDDKINELFKNYFTRDIVVPWQKWHEKNLDQLTLVAQRHRASEKHWVGFFLRECRQYAAENGFPLLYSLEDMREVFRRLDSGKNANKKYKRFLSQAVYEQDLLGNTEKTKEIIAKVLNM